jgi:hypothetical protein
MRRELDYDETAEAVRAWYRQHHRLPVSGEWERATADHPAARSIRRRWGLAREPAGPERKRCPASSALDEVGLAVS